MHLNDEYIDWEEIREKFFDSQHNMCGTVDQHSGEDKRHIVPRKTIVKRRLQKKTRGKKKECDKCAVLKMHKVCIARSPEAKDL